jgi:DNA replication protein DnaC
MLWLMALSDCAVCGGTGWKLVERVEANEPAERVVDRKDARRGASTAAPKFTWAVPCDCTGGDRVTRALTRARVPKRYEHCDFENFDIDLWEGRPNSGAWNKSLSQAKLIVEGFARNYPTAGQTGLLLMGPSGVGKTHLAVAALRQLMSRGHQVRFYDYRELLKNIQASYNPDDSASESSVLAPVLEAEILLLDDIGAGKPSDWVMETIGHILNKRYNEKRVTILTTNYLDGPETQAALLQMPSGQTVAPVRDPFLTDRLGKRVRSRLYEMCRTVEIVSPDYRQEIRQAGRTRS